MLNLSESTFFYFDTSQPNPPAPKTNILVSSCIKSAISANKRDILRQVMHP